MFPRRAMLLAKSDIVILSAASTPETRHLIGANALKSMRRGALLSAWPGAASATTRRRRGARKWSDRRRSTRRVHARGRRPGQPLLRLPNVIITPHVSGNGTTDPLVALFMKPPASKQASGCD